MTAGAGMAAGTVRITGTGRPLDISEHTFGELRRSDGVPDDVAELRRRMVDDGYVFLPGFLDRDEVLATRRDILARAVELGIINNGPERDELGDDPERHKGPTLDRSGTGLNTIPSRSTLLRNLLYGERMMGFFERFFGEPARHFDYTWLRFVPPHRGTPPHMDNVFMNRGTDKLLTAWTPLGDIDRVLGGVAVLAGSHRVTELTSDYAQRDVDTYCANSDDPDELAKATSSMPFNGTLSTDAVTLREQLGLRWLTTDYRAGDVLIFTMFTAHMGLDNNSENRVRLSSDSRYQPASEPADHRWVGPNPTAHGAESKRGLIC